MPAALEAAVVLKKTRGVAHPRLFKQPDIFLNAKRVSPRLLSSLYLFLNTPAA